MVIFLNTFQIPFSLFNYIISNSGYIVKTILQLFAFFCKLFKMKSECHGGLALLFSYPLSYQRGDHFHEPGGIHLILPSLFTYYYTEMVKACQVFSALFCILFCCHYHGDIKCQDKNALLERFRGSLILYSKL